MTHAIVSYSCSVTDVQLYVEHNGQRYDVTADSRWYQPLH
jgi:hypothetical protein